MPAASLAVPPLIFRLPSPCPFPHPEQHMIPILPSSPLGGSDGKESACNEGDVGLIPGSGRSPGSGWPRPATAIGHPGSTQTPATSLPGPSSRWTTEALGALCSLLAQWPPCRHYQEKNSRTLEPPGGIALLRGCSGDKQLLHTV